MCHRILLALALVLFAAPVFAQESQLDIVLKRHKLVVGTCSTSPPLAYVDDQGELAGFEIDMARQITKDLLGDPTKIDFVIVQHDGRFPAVLSDMIDFGMCATAVTPDRAIRVAFTYPYLDSGSAMLARRDANITNIQQLNDPQYTYAVLNVPTAIARTKMVLPNATQLPLDSPSALLSAVKTGRATAFSVEKPLADFYAGENDDLVRVDTTGTALHLVNNDSIYLKPDDFKWWLYLDTYVRELRFGARYEQYTAWYRKWLHKDPPPQRPYDTGEH
jgi:polar amino acid transport system substrate-binding protein